MKNLLNEEINQIKYLLNYDRGLTLSDQKNNLLINEDAAPGGLGGNWNPSTGEYTIVKGDTLSKIGRAFGVKWMDIWEENKGTLRSGQPNCGRYCGYNWIFVGEVVTIPGKTETTTTDTTTTDITPDTTTTDTTTTDIIPDTTTTDTTTTEPIVPVVTPSGSEEEKTGKEKRQEKRAERQANRDARQSERQKRRAERRAERQKRRAERRKAKNANASIPATSTPTLPNTQTADLGNAPKEITDYLTGLLNSNPGSVLGIGETPANDRELAFQEARRKSGKTNLVGNRKVIAKPNGGYKVYAVFK